MMIDQNVVAASPSSVYRVLAGAGLLDRWNLKPSKKGTDFMQPLRPYGHWHVDVAYLNLGGTRRKTQSGREARRVRRSGEAA